MESPSSSGPQVVLLALVAILVIAVVAAVAIAAINSTTPKGPAEPTPILPPILPTNSGSGYNSSRPQSEPVTADRSPYALPMAALGST